MGVAGLEHTAKTLGKSGDAPIGAAKSDVIDPRFDASDPDLAAVVTAWPNLPDALRVGILAMVRATAG